MFIFLFLIVTTDSSGQCANSSNIYSFIYNGHSYEVVRENKTWLDASKCAVENVNKTFSKVLVFCAHVLISTIHKVRKHFSYRWGNKKVYTP